MGSTSDKISGMTNEAVGNVKQGIGKLVGSEKLQIEGAAQEVEGEAQQAVGSAKAGIKDAANKVANTVNRKL